MADELSAADHASPTTPQLPRPGGNHQQPAATRHAAPPVRVCLLGSVNAGKTTFLAGLGILREPNRRTPFRIIPLDARSLLYLDDKTAQLRAGKWPGPSTLTELVRLQVVLDGITIDMLVLDYPGGNFTDALAALREDEAQELRQFVHDADVFLLLADATLDLGLGGGADTIRRQQAFLTTLAHLQRARQQHRSDAQTRAIRTALVLTKCDRYPQLMKRKAVQRLVATHAGALRDKLAEFSTELAYFPISAVGTTRPNEADPEHPLPAPHIEPRGYEALFRWIIRHQRQERRRPWVRWGITLLVLGGFTLGTATVLFLQQERQQFAALAASRQTYTMPPALPWWASPGLRRTFESTMQALLDTAQERLSVASDAQQLDEVCSLLRTTQERADVVPSSRQRAATLLTRCQETVEYLAFQKVQRSVGQAHLLALADAYLQRWPQGRYADEVQSLRSHEYQLRTQEARDTVKALVIRDRQGYVRKAQAILDYLKLNPDDPERQHMRRAVDLAVRLAQETTWDITLVSAGAFNDTYKHGVRIWHNGTLLEQVFDTRDAMPRSTYETSFRLPWQPHDHLKIALVVHLLLRGEQVVAWRELDNAASLLIFDGKQVLSHYDKNWDRSRFAEPAYIAFRIQGFQDGDGAVVKDYLVPGDKW